MISFENILALHKALEPTQTDTQWGIFRNDEEYIVKGSEEKKEIVYIAPDPKNVPDLMEKYVNFLYDNKDTLPRPIGSALAHLYLVIIHPFEDGNGRTARILADKYMVFDKKYTFRPYSISSMIKKNHSGYSARLDAIDKENGLHLFLRYALTMHSLSLDTAISRAKRIKMLNKIFLNYPDFSEEQKHILRTMASDTEKRWSWEEVLFDMEDDEKASDAWNDLVDKKIIQNGKIIYNELDAPFVSEETE